VKIYRGCEVYIRPDTVLKLGDLIIVPPFNILPLLDDGDLHCDLLDVPLIPDSVSEHARHQVIATARQMHSYRVLLSSAWCHMDLLMYIVPIWSWKRRYK
jgi:hypothetical protein